MAFSVPRTWTSGEVISAAIGNTHWRDQFRFLKGLDGTTVLEDSVQLTGTAHMLLANIVTSANRPASSTGGMVYNTSSLNFQFAEVQAGVMKWIDRRDITVMTATSQATGDTYYSSGPTSIARLAAGAAGSILQANGAAAPSWVPNAGALALLSTGAGSLATTGTTFGTLTMGLAGSLSNIVIALRLHASGGSGVAPLIQHGSAGALSTSSIGASLVADSAAYYEVTIQRQGISGSSVHVTSYTHTPVALGGSGVGSAIAYRSDRALGTGWNDVWNILGFAGPATSGVGTVHWGWAIYERKAV